ncbi:MAG: HEAT repeat domain-containing protein [Planctomycetaceae bacterium]
MKVVKLKVGRSKKHASLGVADLRRLRALNAASWHDRQQAFTDLFRAGSESIPTLIAGAKDASPRVRAACVTLMDHLADERCCETLEKALRDPSALVRRHAVHAVGCQTCKAHPLPFDVVAALIDRVLNDSSARVRRVAVHQLGLQPHDPRITDTLTHTLAKSTDTGIISRAKHALRAQQSPAGDRH